MSKNTFIYTLEDPRNGEVRYVGKAINPHGRYKSHVKDKSATHKACWIRQLHELGMSPVLGILEEVESDGDWAEAEKFWIESMRQFGFKLTNLTSGGEGVENLNAESLARKRAKLKGRKITWGDKISNANKGRTLTKEWKTKIGLKLKGKTLSVEHKIKISVAKRVRDSRTRVGQTELPFVFN